MITISRVYDVKRNLRQFLLFTEINNGQ